MVYDVVGVQKVDFKGRDGELIDGTRLHCIVDVTQSDKFAGRKAEPLFLSRAKFPSVKVNKGL